MDKVIRELEKENNELKKYCVAITDLNKVMSLLIRELEEKLNKKEVE